MQATINGLSLHYTDSGAAGSGAPVVFIHGFPFSHAMWEPQMEALRGIRRTLALDLRGHGQSAAGDGQYTMEFFVDDLLALMDHRGIGRAVLCGLSMGGYVALRAAERNPERVAALVLCDTRSEADSNEGKVNRSGAIRLIKEKGMAAFGEGFLKSAFAPASFRDKPEAVERIRRIVEATPPLGACGALLALAARTDTTPALASIAVPALILVGEHDALTPPASARAMHERIRGSRLEIIPGAGHISNLENPEAFHRHLLDFLTSSGV